ncbi:hypothetical protein T09_7703, partial [Trichinella sp. T9]
LLVLIFFCYYEHFSSLRSAATSSYRKMYFNQCATAKTIDSINYIVEEINCWPVFNRHFYYEILFIKAKQNFS